jgi:hypothetical protein
MKQRCRDNNFGIWHMVRKSRFTGRTQPRTGIVIMDSGRHLVTLIELSNDRRKRIKKIFKENPNAHHLLRILTNISTSYFGSTVCLCSRVTIFILQPIMLCCW